MDKKIAIIGTGYVGLVAGACFAKKYDVICADIDESKVEAINDGRAPFFEPGLDELLDEVHSAGRISATTDIEYAVAESDFIFICVGTPSLPDGAIDLSYVRQVAEDIGRALANVDSFRVIIQRSTVVPTTTKNLVAPLIEKNSGKVRGRDFGIAFVPEFLREGNAVSDFLNPDRVIIGADDPETAGMVESLYRDFYSNFPADKFLRMSIESAELVKYASNSFLATKISFANEIAALAEKIPGVDVDEVMRGVGLDHRISPHYFGAGPGFGGSCFPKDLRALIHFARECGIEPILLESVLERNIRQARHIVDVAEQVLGGFDGKRITILGLSFKPNTADMREAPSLRIIEEFRKRGAKDIIAYDPVAIAETKKVIGDLVEYAFSVERALSGSDLAVIVTEWDEFVGLSPEIFVENMRTPVVIDTRRIYDPEEFGGKVRYFAVGRGEV